MWYSSRNTDSRAIEIEELQNKKSALEDRVKEQEESINTAKEDLARSNKRRKHIVRALQKDKHDLIRRLEIRHKQHHESIADSYHPVFEKLPERVEQIVEKADFSVQVELKTCNRCLINRQDNAMLKMESSSIKGTMKKMEARNVVLEEYFKTSSKELRQNQKFMDKQREENKTLEDQSKALTYENKKLKQEIIVLRNKLVKLEYEVEDEVIGKDVTTEHRLRDLDLSKN